MTLSALANDWDADADTLTVTAVGTPTNGTASISGAAVVYTPTQGTTAATDAFTYTISDGQGGTTTSTVSVFLSNRAPVAYAPLFVHATTAVTADLGLFASDPDNDALTVTAVGPPSHGTAGIDGSGRVVYTPDAGTTAASDGFTLSVSDGHGGTATATATIYITNHAPSASNADLIHVSAAVTSDVLASVTDADYDALTITAVSAPTHGTAAVNGDGLVVYTPDVGTTAATDAFSYTVSDGHGGTASATVSVYITNRPPTAVADSASTHSSAVTVSVLANDTDPDGDTLTLTTVGAASRGTVTISGNNVIYTPNATYSVNSDSFTYTISDGHGGTATGTVSVTLTNTAPTATLDSATTHNSSVTISVLANDTDANSDSLTLTAVGTALRGTATISGNTVIYTPNTTYAINNDLFTYTVSDGHGGTTTGTVTITLSNTAPTAVGDNAMCANTASVTCIVLTNDSDANGDALTVSAVGSASHGTAVINSNGTITYTATSGTTATIDYFTYTISDGHGGSTTATVTITITSGGGGD